MDIQEVLFIIFLTLHLIERGFGSNCVPPLRASPSFISVQEARANSSYAVYVNTLLDNCIWSLENPSVHYGYGFTHCEIRSKCAAVKFKENGKSFKMCIETDVPTSAVIDQSSVFLRLSKLNSKFLTISHFIHLKK